MGNEPHAGAFASEDISRYVSRNALMTPDHLVESAWLEHGPFAFWLTEALAPRSFVELGTHSGYSYFVVCQLVKKLGLETSCYAVDAWRGDEHAGFYDDSVFKSVSAENEKYLAFSRLIPSTFSEALKHFADKSIDLLHIDGRHFYEDVKEDFESWRPKVKEGGIVLFHDTNVRERNFGVWKLFDELKASYPTFEFRHGHGLGVLAVGDSPVALRHLFSSDETERATIREIYASLGGAIHKRWLLNQRLASAVEERNALTGERDILVARTDEITRTLAAARRPLSDVSKPARLRVPDSAKIGRFFKGRRFRRDYETLARSPLFDRAWYLMEYPKVGSDDPVRHYLEFGSTFEGLSPGPLFNARLYVEANPDVKARGENPLLHFLRKGAAEKRPLRPTQE